jgi:hypothetical protein
VVVGQHVQGLPVARAGQLEMGDQVFGGCPSIAGVAEAFIANGGQRAVGGGTADAVLLGSEVEALLMPVLGLVEVARPWHKQVGAADTGRGLGLAMGVANSPEEVEGGLEAVAAGRIALFEQQPAEVVFADGEGAQTVAAGGLSRSGTRSR